jgi:ABC-type Fe3+/spermidine/putrescine transport system ATPase subunit
MTRFVAAFLGDSNFIPGRLLQGGAGRCTVETAVANLNGILSQPSAATGTAVVCSIRPHVLAFTPTTGSGENRIQGRVERVAFLGETAQVRVRAGNLTLSVTSLPQAASRFEPGSAVTLSAAAEQVVVLPEELPDRPVP